jgi:hypothetical protein
MLPPFRYATIHSCGLHIIVFLIQSVTPNRFSVFLIFLVPHLSTAQDENRFAAFLPKHINTKHKHTKAPLTFAMVSSQQTAAELLNLSLIVPP